VWAGPPPPNTHGPQGQVHQGGASSPHLPGPRSQHTLCTPTPFPPSGSLAASEEEGGGGGEEESDYEEEPTPTPQPQRTQTSRAQAPQDDDTFFDNYEGQNPIEKTILAESDEVMFPTQKTKE
jgi:hypothetical protein